MHDQPRAAQPADHRPTRLTQLVLALTLIVAVSQAFADAEVVVITTMVAAVIVATACWIAAARLDRPARTAWVLIAAAMTANAIGDVIWETYDLLRDQPPAISWADPFYLLSYPLILAGVIWWLRIRATARIRTILVDAAAVALIPGLVLWQAMMVTPDSSLSDSLLDRLVLPAYPVGDVLIFGAVAAVLFSSARRDADVMLVAGFAASLFIADSLFGTLWLVPGSTLIPQISDGAYFVAYGLLTAAALAQHRRNHVTPAADRRTGTSHLRLILLGIAVCGAPAAAIGSVALGLPVQAKAYTVASLVIGLTVVVRFTGLVRSLEREQARLSATESRLAHQATHDDLTGLPNRPALTDRLDREVAAALGDGAGLAVMFFDLDNFKTINDTLGHQTGDQLLVAIAERVTAAVREHDFVARSGGDEFVIVAPDLTDVTAATALAERVLAVVDAPVDLHGNLVHPTGSIGVAILDGQTDAHQLIADADLALYRAKDAGGRTVCVFDPKLRHAVDEQTALASGVRRALDLDELAIAYQPQVDLATGQIRSAEALVRWPGRPDVPVWRLIEVAEMTGQIDRLGRHVLDRACADIRLLSDATATQMAVAVNVSMRQLLHEPLPAIVADAVRRHRLAPGQLILELTETCLADEPVLAMGLLKQIRALGVRVEIDDFGKGYSSLARLAALPVDGLKIDRGFIAPLGEDSSAAALVEAVVQLGRATGLEVTAEGIETEQQATIVRATGCNFGQGYLFGRPMSRDDLAALISGGDSDRTPALSTQDPHSTLVSAITESRHG